MALDPLADQIGRQVPRRLAARQRQRRQPGKAVQRLLPGPRRRRGIEDRDSCLHIDALAVKAETAAQQRVGIFQPARRRIMGMEDEMVGQLALEQAAIEPAAPPARRAAAPAARREPAPIISGSERQGDRAAPPSASQGGDIGGVLCRAALEHRRARHQHGGAGGDHARLAVSA